MGTLIVAFHNVWSGFPMAVTLLGWSMVLKATVTFVSPDLPQVFGPLGNSLNRC